MGKYSGCWVLSIKSLTTRISGPLNCKVYMEWSWPNSILVGIENISKFFLNLSQNGRIGFSLVNLKINNRHDWISIPDDLYFLNSPEAGRQVSWWNISFRKGNLTDEVTVLQDVESAIHPTADLQAPAKYTDTEQVRFLHPQWLYRLWFCEVSNPGQKAEQPI